MWQRTAVLLATVVVVNCIDVRLFKRYHGSSIKVDCFDYPAPRDVKYFRSLGEGYRKKEPPSIHTTPKYRPSPKLARRSDNYIKDIVKEHAKLVQDINSLRQVLFVPPLADESKDYEDSIFHEILETSTTVKPTMKTYKQKHGIPLILAGTTSHTVTSPPVKFKQTINLVGSSVTPIVKHPYPFEVPTNQRSPLRVCMATPLSTKDPYAKRKPNLWERLASTLRLFPNFKL